MIIFRILLRMLLLVWQSMSLALGQIWVNKMRSVLTMLGIIIGVASVTSVIAALTCLRTKVLSDFESIGTNKMFAGANRPRTGPMRNASWRDIRFKPDICDGLLEACPSVARYTRMGWDRSTVQYGDQKVDEVSVTGIDPAWHKIENRSVTDGRPFSMVDVDQGRPVCMINPQLRTKLRLSKECVGEHLIIDGRRYTLVGIVEPEQRMSMLPTGEPQSEVFVPFTHLCKVTEPGMYLSLAAKSPELSADALAELRFFLRKQRHIAPGDPDTFQAEAMEEFVRKFNEIAMAITLVASGIVGISLLVGGVGIMNIMLVSVSERTREIGLRKAVGARPAAIMMQFLVEAVTLCFVGGMIGVLAGEGIARLLAKIPKLDQAHVPLWAVAIAFGFAAAVGLVFGFFPAVKAARLDPIDALRHE